MLLPVPLVTQCGNAVVGWCHRAWVGMDGKDHSVFDTTCSTSYSTSLRILLPLAVAITHLAARSALDRGPAY